MQLHLGKMTRLELAEWFGVKPNTYDHSKKKKMEELKFFAEFEEVFGGVNITKIKFSTYEKKGSKAYRIILDNLTKYWHKSGYDTASRVGYAMWKDIPELKENIAEITAKVYTAKARAELFGRVHMSESGSIGTCKYAYVKSNDWDEAVLLTEEQKKILGEIVRSVYVNEQEPLLYESWKNHEITTQDYEEAIKEWNSSENRAARYVEFKTQILEKLGFDLDKVTLVEERAF